MNSSKLICQKTQAKKQYNPANILVVDDETELERLIEQRFRKQIRNQEFHFEFVNTGSEALIHLRTKRKIDVILTDINMPEMDGLTFLKLLPNIDQYLKAVVVSAYSDIRNIRTAMNHGAFDFLFKPVDFQDLETTIYKTLAYVQKARERQQNLQQIQDKLAYEALHDWLTGLPNRRWFMKALNHSIQSNLRYPNRCFAVFFIDLDQFKVINDNLGHSAGDRVLQCLAVQLQKCVRVTDRVARLGGDEFAVLLEEVQGRDEVTKIAQRILEELARPLQINGCEVRSGCSIGIILNTIGYQRAEEILQDADKAMYVAKARGKGRYVIFDSILLG